MKANTKNKKKSIQRIINAFGRTEVIDQLYRIFRAGKTGFDSWLNELGLLIAVTIMYMEREEVAGPEYKPFDSSIQKWASQEGSIFIGDQKVKVSHPRLRGPKGEIALQSYLKLKEPRGFSEELLEKILHGISCRKYSETVLDSAKAYGVSGSSISHHIVEATSRKLQEFKERSLKHFISFAIFLDTIHRGGEAFIVALGINTEGEKMPLGFWQGATENHEICEELFADLERRGLVLSKRIIYVTDGGKGVIKALKERFGKKLLHQRCTIHKDRNIQRHLAKKYRNEAHRLFRTALSQNSYQDAKQMLLEMEKWLRGINESAADSLLEALEEILTLHRLNIPEVLRKTLHSTNPIESVFSSVRSIEKNIKRYRDSRMMQRWLAAVLIHAEKSFRKVNGQAFIQSVIEKIEIEAA